MQKTNKTKQKILQNYYHDVLKRKTDNSANTEVIYHGVTKYSFYGHKINHISSMCVE